MNLCNIINYTAFFEKTNKPTYIKNMVIYPFYIFYLNIIII